MDPPESVTAFTLRRALDECGASVPPERSGLTYALRVCADALAKNEQPLQLRELSDALDDYVAWWGKGEEERKRLEMALEQAGLIDVNYSCTRTTTILAEPGQDWWIATATSGRSESGWVKRSRSHG